MIISMNKSKYKILMNRLDKKRNNVIRLKRIKLFNLIIKIQINLNNNNIN